jgi:hypothetical protein
MMFSPDGCESIEILSPVIASHPDVATVCVQPNYPGEGLPITLGAPSRDALVTSHVLDLLRTDPKLGIWTGDNLLLTGCSDGATRYPAVAARYNDDSKWLGSQKTAACLSDGVVSLPYQDRFVGEKIGLGPSCATRHARMVAHYTREQPTPGHSCAGSPNQQCACDPDHATIDSPGDCSEGDCVAFDSIIRKDSQSKLVFAPGVTPEDFAVTHWRIISEGDNWAETDDRCEKDVVPEAPFRAFCEAIDSGESHDCSFVSVPDEPHCSFYAQQLTKVCVEWFKGIDP